MTDDEMIQPVENESSEEQHESEDVASAPDLDLARVRELVLAAHPDVVQEMVQGSTFDELLASVEPAREAYQRIASEAASLKPAPKVAFQPGQRSTSLADIESLSPLGKISEGLRRV